MKRLVLIIFVIVGISLGLIFFMEDATENTSQGVTRSQTIIPQTTAQKQETVEVQIEETDDSLVSLVPLHSDETLLSTLSVDFDGDGYDDQINSLKKMTSPYIQILVGLYNPYKGQYERSAIIDTEIIQTPTFSYTSMDFVGTHKNFLMYSGFLENNDSVMKLFSPEKQDTGLVMNMVGDFRSDGTIFVQQLERHESYESQQANGVSFPVWVYRSDTSSGQNSLDQIQTRYVWNETSGKYVKDTFWMEPSSPFKTTWKACGTLPIPTKDNLCSLIPAKKKLFSRQTMLRKYTLGSVAPYDETASTLLPSTAPSPTSPAVLILR